MLLKKRYKPDLTKTKIIEGKKNILRFKTENTKEYLQITEFGWGFVWLMFKYKVLKRLRIFLVITPLKENYDVHIDFFTVKK